VLSNFAGYVKDYEGIEREPNRNLYWIVVIREIIKKIYNVEIINNG